MKNKEVIIPKEIIHPEFDNNFRISFYKNKTDAKNEDLTHIDLPHWFGNLIHLKIESEKRKAVDDFKKYVKEMFN